jgi:hypothetical protein
VSDPSGTFYTGLNFKLDVGLYQLDQQVACQRYRQTTLDANKVSQAKAAVADLFARSNFALKRSAFELVG